MTDTGLVVMHEDRSVVQAVSIKTKPADGLDDTRAAIIVEKILDIVTPYTDDAHVYICIEDIPFSRNATGKLFTRYGIFATLKYLLRKAGIETYVVGATTLKNKFAGKGTAKKDAVIAAIFQKYKLTIKNDNIADAFAAASVLISYKREKLKLNISKIPME